MARINAIPAPHDFDGLAPTMSDLVGQSRTLLAQRGIPVGRVVGIAPGNSVAWDECCEGYLYGRLVTVTPVYPQKRNAQGGYCAPIRYNVTAAMGVLRCAAVQDNQGNPPKPSQILGDGYAMSADMLTLMQVLSCNEVVSELFEWQALGPDGGCHGGEWTFTLQLPA